MYSKRDAPRQWLISILVGILKTGKVNTDASSYRLVGLESCLLKMLTMLIEMRLTAWADWARVLPDSQNGFREGYRTSNNGFVLRCAIDRARAEGKALFVAFIDLKDAFPSTDVPTLWSKLYRLGVAGPIFDWLRMLYRRMTFMVRHNGEFSESFKSFIGLLTGDTASPVLWNIYFCDLEIHSDADDIRLGGRAICHVEQADDVALFSTTADGLQRKISSFCMWCSLNSMTVSVQKTKWMLLNWSALTNTWEFIFLQCIITSFKTTISSKRPKLGK